MQNFVTEIGEGAPCLSGGAGRRTQRSSWRRPSIRHDSTAHDRARGPPHRLGDDAAVFRGGDGSRRRVRRRGVHRRQAQRQGILLSDGGQRRRRGDVAGDPPRTPPERCAST